MMRFNLAIFFSSIILALAPSMHAEGDVLPASEFAKKWMATQVEGAKELRKLAAEARAAGAPKAAAEADVFAASFATEEALKSLPVAAETAEVVADEKAEKKFADKLKATRPKILAKHLELWKLCRTKGFWREQTYLVPVLGRLGVEDAAVRKVLGMVECETVGWCWTLETPHYQIITNLPAETQLEIVESAEDTFEAFCEFFRSYAKLGKPASKLVMYYFNTREELLSFAGKCNVPVGFGYGVYYPGDGKCYFRVDKDLFGISGVIYHEGVHQLHDKLLMTMSGTPSWVTEGLASYFETLIRRDGKLVVGSAGRSDVWHLSGAHYIPMKPLIDNEVEWGQLDQAFKLPNLNPQYGQVALMFRYFVEAEGGKYKDAFLGKIVCKAGQGKVADLEKHLGITLAGFIPQYVEFANKYFKNPITATP